MSPSLVTLCTFFAFLSVYSFLSNNPFPPPFFCSHGGIVAGLCCSSGQGSCFQARCLLECVVEAQLWLCLLRVFALPTQTLVLSLCFPVPCSLLKYERVRHFSHMCHAKERSQSLLCCWYKFLFLLIRCEVKPT